MQSSEIVLEVNGVQFSHWVEYTVDLSLYSGAGSFSFSASRIDAKVRKGMQCRILSGGVPILTGVIDSTEKSYSVQGVSWRVEGRSLIGLAVDQYVTKFGSHKGKNLKELVQLMFAEIPFLSRMKIEVSGASGAADVPDEISPEPGESVFEFIRRAASSRGVLVYGKGDGTVVIGKPSGRGRTVHSIELLETRSGEYDNRSLIISGRVKDGVPEHYHEIRVFGQQDGEDDDFRVKFSAIDEQAPLKKVLCRWRGNGATPKEFSRQIIEQQRWAAFQLEYEFKGHGDRETIWGIDQLCKVKDDLLEVNGNYLIHSVSYRLSKSTGIRTVVKLGCPGVTLD